ncbi:MAG TPA: hypothetical protein VFZ97_08300 [Acidimicrobiales bacterium]
MDTARVVYSPSGIRYSIMVVPRGMPLIQIPLTWALGWIIWSLLPGDQWKIWITVSRPRRTLLGRTLYEPGVTTPFIGFRSKEDAMGAARDMALRIERGEEIPGLEDAPKHQA